MPSNDFPILSTQSHKGTILRTNTHVLFQKIRFSAYNAQMSNSFCCGLCDCWSSKSMKRCNMTSSAVTWTFRRIALIKTSSSNCVLAWVHIIYFQHTMNLTCCSFPSQFLQKWGFKLINAESRWCTCFLSSLLGAYKATCVLLLSGTAGASGTVIVIGKQPGSTVERWA